VLDRWLAGRGLFVVTTPRVLALHGAAIGPLRAAAVRCRVIEVEEGEAAKTPASAARLWREMLAAGGRRDSRLVCFGGGSVGDLGGFVAGCFLRGVEYAQLPTTLLAQADAAIGGKTAVDLPEGKNAVGLFHQPALVVGEAAFLATLPPEELRSGLAEVIKVAALLDLELLARLEADLPRLLAGEPGALGPAVAAAAAAKARLVVEDPHDRGRRALLNLGHTLGHALEAALGYRDLRHGDAVAYGLLFALRLSQRRGLDAAFAERLRRLVGRLGLPPLPAVEPAALVALMARDKKAREAGLDWILLAAPGQGTVAGDVGVAEIAEELRRFAPDPFAAGRRV
jgi:3-dehydroquinate synthetase